MEVRWFTPGESTSTRQEVDGHKAYVNVVDKGKYLPLRDTLFPGYGVHNLITSHRRNSGRGQWGVIFFYLRFFCY